MTGRVTGGRVGWLLAGPVRRWSDTARRVGHAFTPPLPRVGIDAGRSVPGWAARLLLAALGAGCLLLLRPGALATVLAAALLAVVLLRPGGAAAPVFCGVLGVYWLVLPVPDPVVFVLLALASAVPALGSAIGNLALSTRIQLIALRPALVRFGMLQLGTQPALALALLLSRQQLALLPVTVVAVALVAVAAWRLLPRLR